MIWKDINTIPNANEPIVCTTYKRRIVPFIAEGKDRWKFFVDYYSIRYWAYQNDLINEVDFIFNNKV